MTEVRVLHARSGVVLQQEGDGAYVLTSLRGSDERRFADLEQAERVFDTEVAASERDPDIVARLGGS
ncbi:hypothetical protein [Brevundimonas nasdae]|uniref:Prevent-host-death protein n=1 Tax=Brevundimonas nasdae TaxID=172043 RepID=A0ABX8TFV2_9CAUL|nr:hypothetical protein [Brevundimonas nasdae]QYC08968.1 hypothetical protein KWG56_09975 [Brevundimonas nasdae]QYC15018.1 hypothetical protein KWG63_05310 [Brevundimonas nasdae]